MKHASRGFLYGVGDAELGFFTAKQSMPKPPFTPPPRFHSGEADLLGAALTLLLDTADSYNRNCFPLAPNGFSFSPVSQLASNGYSDASI